MDSLHLWSPPQIFDFYSCEFECGFCDKDFDAVCLHEKVCKRNPRALMEVPGAPLGLRS